jgi:UDP:flavonoid glycosyltransferase YjiC (YdhE family)
VWDHYRRGTLSSERGDRYLDACPPPLQNDQIALIDHVLPIRPVSFEGPPALVPDWTNTLARPAAYLTLGTVPVFSTPERLRHLVDAVAPVVASLVVTTGPNSVSSLGALPSNVLAVAYLPQTARLDRVDLVISQGGAGGTLGAIGMRYRI